MTSFSEIKDYRASKGRDPLTSKPDSMSRCIAELDLLISEHTLLVDRCLLDISENEEVDGARIQELDSLIKKARQHIVNGPDSKWTEEVLDHRIRQEHYK